MLRVLETPLYLKGTVVPGFGRGSKMLGIPTANLNEETLRQHKLDETANGIYAGFAAVGTSEDVYHAVLSVGWNPHFKNERRTAETWILHDFGRDFYGDELRVMIVGYIRPEAAFENIGTLIQQIKMDAEIAKKELPRLSGRDDPFLKYV